MVRLRFKPRAAIWQAQMKPLSYGVRTKLAHVVVLIQASDVYGQTN